MAGGGIYLTAGAVLGGAITLTLLAVVALHDGREADCSHYAAVAWLLLGVSGVMHEIWERR
jgi:hypothetical protein